MKIKLKNRNQKPPFGFLVKENTSSFKYYVFVNPEDAMEKARILSLTGFPTAVVLEPFEKNEEWFMRQTFVFHKGECFDFEEKDLLHAKFYTDAGECINHLN